MSVAGFSLETAMRRTWRVRSQCLGVRLVGWPGRCRWTYSFARAGVVDLLQDMVKVG